ncbi:MAG TPA: methyltransferase domain-containing protein [Actinomycetota bacterium]
MTTEGPREWDADAYDRLPIPMTAWGAAVLEWLDLRGDERVLDAGCGTGQVTSMLRDRLPHGWVIALDGSVAMIERARERLGGDRVGYVVADLASPSSLPIEPIVDAVLSTATFHWILDHDALFRGLAAVVRPGGQLAAQCGGEGNIASIESALAEMGEDLRGRKHFATPSATQERLVAAGFVDVECWLSDEPTELPASDLEPYLETICLGDHVAGMDPAARRAFVRQVAARMPGPVIDYVRLNIRARRG